MEEAVSSILTSLIVFTIYIVVVASFSYLLFLPTLNKLGLNRQISFGISKIVFIIIISIVAIKHFTN